MKSSSLAPLVIACLALLAPRLATTGGEFGGAIAVAKLCDSKNINHACSGPSDCRPVPSTETTTNHAQQYYIEGTSINNCAELNPTESNCIGLATAPDEVCDREKP